MELRDAKVFARFSMFQEAFQSEGSAYNLRDFAISQEFPRLKVREILAWDEMQSWIEDVRSCLGLGTRGFGTAPDADARSTNS